MSCSFAHIHKELWGDLCNCLLSRSMMARFIKKLLWARQGIVYLILTTLQEVNAVRIPVFRWRNWGTGKLNDLPKNTQVKSERACTWPSVQTVSLSLSLSVLLQWLPLAKMKENLVKLGNSFEPIAILPIGIPTVHLKDFLKAQFLRK